jgi:hypothetical protein
MNRLLSIVISIPLLLSVSFFSEMMDSSRGGIVILYLLLFLASLLGGISLLSGGITGNYDIGSIISDKDNEPSHYEGNIKKLEISGRTKVFQVDYFINNKRYGIPARELVTGTNIMEVRAKYLSDPKVKRVLQVKPIS